jgi:hypothetical protein
MRKEQERGGQEGTNDGSKRREPDKTKTKTRKNRKTGKVGT